MPTITESMIQRYFELSETAKSVEKELKEIKRDLNFYFDEIVGQNQKGESSIGDFKVQRIIRCTESFDEEKTVKRLEEKQLTDCIQVVRLPDKQKIEAAVTLGLLNQNEIEDCVVKKVSNVFNIRKR